MIENWDDFNEWRSSSLSYHKLNGYGYETSLTYFEYVRKYFNENGFPTNDKKYKNGKLKPWTKKDIQQQKQNILDFVTSLKNERKTKIRSYRR